MLIKKNRLPIKDIILIGFLPSFLKKFIYRLKGYSIGKNVSIGLGSVIIGKSVSIGDGTSIGFITVIRAREIKIDRFVKIGSFNFLDTERIEIGEDTRINEQVIIAGIKTPDSLFRIGKRGIIMEYSYVNPTKPIIMGDDCGIGGHCLLFTHGSWLSQIDGFPVTFAPITFGDRVWLPWRVFIMPGVTIGSDVVIGANSLVSKNLPSNCLAAGSPAKIISDSYPPELLPEKRKAIIGNIINDFIAFLDYNNISTTRNKIDEDSFEVTVSKDGNNSHILFFNQTNLPEPKFSDNLLIIDSDDINTKLSNKKFKSVINLSTKERIGTSSVGEEMISFFSRYGIRFNRLD